MPMHDPFLQFHNSALSSPLKDLLDACKKQELEDKKSRAFDIYLKCLRRNHLTIADKIEKKYSLYRFVGSDIAMAFGFALLASKEENNDNL